MPCFFFLLVQEPEVLPLSDKGHHGKHAEGNKDLVSGIVVRGITTPVDFCSVSPAVL